MKTVKIIFLKSSILLLLFLSLFTLFFFKTTLTKSTQATSINTSSRKSLVDLTGDGVKETIEILDTNGFFDIKITSKSSTILLSSLIPDNKLCSSQENNIFKLRFINLSRDSKPEIFVQGIKDDSIINYIFSYNKNFELILSHSNNISGIIDSNLIKTPQLISLNYHTQKENIKSNMLINNELITSSPKDLKFPGIDNAISLIDYINLDVEIDTHPDIFTDSIPSSELSNLWKLDKNTFNYTFKGAFFFDSTLDAKGNIIECTYILSFSKANKKDGNILPFDVEIKLTKSYYNDLRISEMRFFSQTK